MFLTEYPPHYPSMNEDERAKEIKRLKRLMKSWDSEDFREKYALIKERLSGGSKMGEVEHTREATKLMLLWQAMREFLEEKLDCISK
jgi:hypothetical protein